ncbi:MAG TPA: cytochrome c [Candidatus Methylacidiphilales bacterium]|nr:cytochrome c [Candidatus Methylacidiphilales bacterium]
MKHEENPDLQPPEVSHTDALKPNAPDFVETPDIEPLSREHEALPTWLYLICGFALFMAGSSFTGFQIFGAGLYDQGPGAPVLASNNNNNQAAKITDPMILGKNIFNNNCASCHHADGLGQPGMYPPIGGSAWVCGNKARLAAIILQGLSGPLTVNGQSYGTAVMPAWGPNLTDDKIADVMTYIRGSFGNSDNATTEDEVSQAHTRFGSHANAFTQDELLKIAPDGPDPSDTKK